jgi:hypothetical protein
MRLFILLKRSTLSTFMLKYKKTFGGKNMGQITYVVTTGNKAEYTIQDVLVDKTLAYRYAEKIGGNVEERITADEKINAELKKQKHYFEVQVTYSLWSNIEEPDFNLSIHKRHSMTHSPKLPSYEEQEEVRHTFNHKVKQFGFKTLHLYFQVEDEINVSEKDVRKKYHQKSKKAFDSIQAFIASGGYNEELINSWLAQNFKNAL